MLILEQWLNEKGGALLRTEEGVRIFRTLNELEDSYVAFAHTSAEGVLSDKHIFIRKERFASQLLVAV